MMLALVERLHFGGWFTHGGYSPCASPHGASPVQRLTCTRAKEEECKHF